MGLQCEIGLRCRTYYVLCGSVLSVWNELEEVLTPVSGTNVKVQIVRLRTEDGQRIVGERFPIVPKRTQVVAFHPIFDTYAVDSWVAGVPPRIHFLQIFIAGKTLESLRNW